MKWVSGMRILIITMLVALLSGCIILPIDTDWKVSLTMKGAVSDDESGLPVTDALVTLSLPENYRDTHFEPLSTTTNEQGEFAVGPIVERKSFSSFWFLGPAEGDCIAVITVRAVGYKPFKHTYHEFGGAAMNGACSSQPITKHIQLERTHI